MAKNSVSEWSETPSENNDVAGISIKEGWLPSVVNNVVRAIMAQIRSFFKANVFRLWDGTDETKQLAFDLSGLTTATTRTLVLQDKNGTVALSADIETAKEELEEAIAAAYSQPNLIVNGSLIDSQQNGNTLGTTNGHFAADQFALYFTASSAAMSIQRIQSTTLAGSANKLEFKTTTAKTTLSATDYVSISQPIEGSRPEFVAAGWGAAGAKQFVFRFEFSAPAGLYHVHATNSAANRHIAIPFTVEPADAGVAKVREVVIPGDTGGTWLKAEGTIGVLIDIVLAAGSSLTGGTANTWGGTTYYAATTQKNILDSTSNVVRLADFGMRLDPDATGVYGRYRVGEAHPVYRSERYYEKSYDATVAPGANTNVGALSARASNTSVAISLRFSYPKCKIGTVITYSPNGTINAVLDVSNSTNAASSVANVGEKGAEITASVSSGALVRAHYTAVARLS